MRKFILVFSLLITCCSITASSSFIDYKNNQEVSTSQRTFKYTIKVWKGSELVYEQTGCESLISIEQEKQRLKQVYNTDSVFADITYSEYDCMLQ